VVSWAEQAPLPDPGRRLPEGVSGRLQVPAHYRRELQLSMAVSSLYARASHAFLKREPTPHTTRYPKPGRPRDKLDTARSSHAARDARRYPRGWRRDRRPMHKWRRRDFPSYPKPSQRQLISDTNVIQWAS
jgi:hypothetical protein